MLSKIFFETLCQKYNLGILKRYSRIPLGLINAKYLLETNKGKYVVRISVRSAKQLAFEIALLNHVKSLPVPQLKFDKQENFINFYKRKPFIVYKYIEGGNPKKITTNLIKQIARFQACFHKLGFSFKKNIDREPYTYNLPPAKIKRMEKMIIKKTPKIYYKKYFVIRNILLNIKLPKNLPSGPIHVDIKPENTLIKNNKLSGILDFDNSYIGPYLIDIGKTLTWYCIKNKKINWSYVKLFLKEYSKYRSFENCEKNNIEDIIKHAIASHIFIDYYKLTRNIIPLSYLKMLLKEFYPVLEVINNIEKKKASKITYPRN
ncbi:MAG: phosphotransferase [Patescibacteria group bacterium]|nr:phosphotransferase [Patescibacteria group bacterium]